MSIEAVPLVPVVSFCTSVMNRLHHLRHTISKNIATHGNTGNVEYVILDYSSTDGLQEWIRTEMREHIETGLIVFAQSQGDSVFQRCRAKNMAHRLARGEILCNLDADNFIGSGFSEHLEDQFRQKSSIYVRARGRGLTGRIAFRRADFFSLGGYDERMTRGWGHEDIDIARRAQGLGLQPIICPRFGSAIQHSDGERTINCDSKNKDISRRIHTAISRNSLRQGKLIANQSAQWGAGMVLVNFRSLVSLG